MRHSEVKNRIEELQADLLDERSGAIKKGSLKSFWSFIAWADACGIAERPAIALTPTNEIYVTWVVGKERHSFLFQENGVIKHVYIYR